MHNITTPEVFQLPVLATTQTFSQTIIKTLVNLVKSFRSTKSLMLPHEALAQHFRREAGAPQPSALPRHADAWAKTPQGAAQDLVHSLEQDRR